ncbi:MAG: phosphate-selective porin [Myxococcales bacterium]|nr:phosphate-selective porin [Myxococcales bacterium]
MIPRFAMTCRRVRHRLRRAELAAIVAAIIFVGSPAGAEGLRPATTHNGWAIDLDSFIQIDAVPWSQDAVDELDPSTGEPLNTTTIFVRRAFLRAEARRDSWYAAMELDGNSVKGPTARLLGAQVAWSYPGPKQPLLTIAGGLMLIPFGMGVPTNARFRSFVEQPMFLQALFPGEYDAGLRASGEYGLVRWVVAAMNGAPTKDRQWNGRDPSASYDVLGRIGAVVPLPNRGRVEVGLSALTGSGLHAGTPPTKDQLQWVDENQDGIVQTTELQVIPGMVGTRSQSFHHNAIGVDAAVHWCLRGLGHGVAFFEGALSTNLDRAVIYADPIAQSRDLRELGYALGVVQDLGDHALAGVRYDRYDADRDASQRAGVGLVTTNQVFSTLALMAAARWNTVRLIAEYDHARNPTGRSDSGVPTTSASDRVTVRAQVEF